MAFHYPTAFLAVLALVAASVMSCAPASPPTAVLPVEVGPPELFDLTAFSRGEKSFRKRGCNACHGFGEYFGKCPDLSGVTARQPPEWIRKWLKDPDGMRQTDEYARELSARYEAVMPDLGLTDREIEDLLIYLSVGGKLRGSR